MRTSSFSTWDRRSLLTICAKGSAVALGATIVPVALARGAVPGPGLRIEVATGTGEGATRISAYDQALRQMGIENVNLIRLSSVIPPAATVVRADRIGKPIGWGDRLYSVYALQHENRQGRGLAAGLGWVQRGDGSGAGLFVEHTGETASQVEDLIHASLADMVATRPESFGPVHTAIAATRCGQHPTCAMALAAYQTLPWT